MRPRPLSFLFASALPLLPAQQAVILPAGQSGDVVAAAAGSVRPSPRQLAWQRLGFLAFVHFGMNTFTGREWGDGSESPATFAPTDFDPDQWAETFAAAGMRGVVLTCKHHDGFCLWPSETTAHDVAASPWHQGKGDVVGAVAAACRRHGLRFGIYLSPWDRNAKEFGTKAYQQLFLQQLRELCTGYGPLCEVWLDGAHCPPDDPEVFDWQAVFAMVRELQPEAVIAITGPDVRWVGNESGRTRADEWSVLPLDTDDPGPFETSRTAWQSLWRLRERNQDRDLGSRERLAGARRLVFWPAETDVSIRPGWFWRQGEDAQVKSLPTLLDIWFSAVGGNAVLLLNVPPDRRGRLADPDVAVLQDLGEWLRRTFRDDLALGAAKRKTYARAGEVYFDEPRTVDVVELREDLEQQGQRVEAFRIDTWDGEQWRERARGSTIGHRRLLRIEPTEARGFRYWVERSRGKPAIARFSLWRQPLLLAPPRIERDPDGKVRILADREGIALHYTLDGSAPTPDSPRYEEPIALPDGGTVRALAQPMDAAIDAFAPRTGSSATAVFGMATAGWQVLDCSSEQAPREAAQLAFDGNPATHWHTSYGHSTPQPPHHLSIDLGAEVAVTGFVYLPRQEGTNGTVADYEFAVRGASGEWRTVAAGTFAREGLSRGEAQPVRLPRVERGVRAVRFTSRREIEGRAWASCAELAVQIEGR